MCYVGIIFAFMRRYRPDLSFGEPITFFTFGMPLGF